MTGGKVEKRVIMRPATRADLVEIVRLLADDELGSGRERLAEPLPAGYEQAFATIETDPNNELIVAEQGGVVVGTMQLTVIPSLSFQGSRRLQIESVRVDGRYRNQGIGRLMMEWAIERAREKNCRLVQLTTHKSRTDAHRFYARLGFVASHEGMKLDLMRDA
jgi:ribosomal protein S18 acetylase RimI-like enzyme